MKGLQYEGIEDERLPRGIRAAWQRGNVPADEREAWVERFNRQWEIVAECGVCSEPLIRGERVAHLMHHAPDAMRPLLRRAAEFGADDRGQLREWMERVLEAAEQDADDLR